MKKEFSMMLIIVVCAVLGIICAAIANILYEQGVIINSLINSSITIADFQFAIFFVWLIVGIIIGVMKN